MCIRDRVYAGTMKRSVCTRIVEHSRYCCLRQPEKSLANADHCVLFEETKILSLVSGYYPWLHLESIEIYKHGPAAMNRRGLLLNRICYAVLLNQSDDYNWSMLFPSLHHAGIENLYKGPFLKLKTWFASLLGRHLLVIFYH